MGLKSHASANSNAQGKSDNGQETPIHNSKHNEMEKLFRQRFVKVPSVILSTKQIKQSLLAVAYF